VLTPVADGVFVHRSELLRNLTVVVHGRAGALVVDRGPRDVPHGFHVDSAEARLLRLFWPAGVEGFFRDAKPTG